MSREVAAGALATLHAGEVRVVALGRDSQGRPIEALIVRAEDELRAFLNRCQHLPIPLDGGSRSFWAPDQRHLRCGTHGALFRPDDGFCVLGPCAGASLLALRLRVEPQGSVWIEVPDEI